MLRGAASGGSDHRRFWRRGRRPRGGEAVDAAIVLAADVSRSIDDEEFDLQRRGYAAAIVSDKVMEAIHAGPHGAIALAYVEWAGEGEQTIVVDWMVLRAPGDADEIRRRADRSAARLRRPHGDRLGARFRHGTVRRRRDRRRPQGDRRFRRRHEQSGPRRRRGARRGGQSRRRRSTACRSSTVAPPRRRLSGAAHQPAGRAGAILPRQRDRRPRRVSCCRSTISANSATR